MSETQQKAAQFTFVDLRPRQSDFLADALAGLRSSPKRLPPKYFYDRRGSELFEQITETPEYYLTRAESEILNERAAEIAEEIDERTLLIEFGSGSSRKTRLLLDALEGRRARYLAVDISRAHLAESAEDLSRAYTNLEVFALCADYARPLEFPAEAMEGVRRKIVFFPGSTIGNFSPGQAGEFLRMVAEEAGRGGRLILGADLKKDPRILEAAYNDRAGVTAQFNLNLLERMNRELEADFDRTAFSHCAYYNEQEGRIEMHLRSRVDQVVRVAGEEIQFRAGETIHTENSYKFDLEQVQDLAADAGFAPVQAWTDSRGYFSVHLLEAP